MQNTDKYTEILSMLIFMFVCFINNCVEKMNVVYISNE